MSLSALVKNLAYNRCIQACSAPPIYLSTGKILFTVSLSKGALSFLLSAYLKKYQLLHTKVSSVSASRTALPPQRGQVVFIKPLCFLRGLSPSGRKSTS